MRIALIDPSLFTAPYDAALAGGLRALGHSVDLHGRRLRAEDGAPDGLTVTGSFYPVASLPVADALPKPLRLAVKGVDHIASMSRLHRRLRAEGPDVIHFQWLPLPMVDRLFLSGLRKLAPLVLTVHDSKPFNGNPAAGLQRHGVANGFRYFDRLIVHTGQGQERLRETGVAKDRIAVIPHGLLAPRRTAVGTAESPPNDVTFLLFGKIKPYKGAELLVEAFARIPPTRRGQARVRIVGRSYMDLGPLNALVHRLGIATQVAVEPRFVPDSEIPALFGTGTITVFPYREIEASGVLSLALAHARPVIASRLGGFAETIRDGVDGLLVPPGDATALAEAMTRFLTGPDFVAACSGAIASRAAAVPEWTEIAGMTVQIYADAARDAAVTAPASRVAAPPRPPADVRS